MTVSKKVLRSLLGVKLSRIELLEPSGVVAKSIYSVGKGEPVELRFFPYLSEAESFFFDQVRKVGAGRRATDGMPDLLHAQVRVGRRH